jgi:hypothetical protein
MKNKTYTHTPLERLRHHVSGAVARGESSPVVEIATPATHTPGPWAVEPSWGEPGRMTLSAPTTQTAHQERGLICSTDGTPFREQELANARLIAAAPDLLSALQVIAADGKRDGWIPSYHYGEVQKAIAKAEGRAE